MYSSTSMSSNRWKVTIFCTFRSCAIGSMPRARRQYRWRWTGSTVKAAVDFRMLGQRQFVPISRVWPQCFCRGRMHCAITCLVKCGAVARLNERGPPATLRPFQPPRYVKGAGWKFAATAQTFRYPEDRAVEPPESGLWATGRAVPAGCSLSPSMVRGTLDSRGFKLTFNRGRRPCL